MKALGVFVVILVSTFALAFFTKRRYGVLGLALCAGALLSSGWAATLTPIVEQQGITLVSPPLGSVVACVLILLPAILLVFSGPTYHKLPLRIAGSAVFAVMALVFMLGPLGAALVFDDTSQRVYDTATAYGNGIVVAGIALALADILLTRTPHRGKGKDH